MFRKRLQNEEGYSLIEVIVTIIILAIGIIPMVTMFDMGLHSATAGGNYDKARALANLKMEEAKSLPFITVKNNFPVTGSAPDTATGHYQQPTFVSETGPASADFNGFQYRVEKQIMKHDTAPGSPTINFQECDVLPNTCSATPTGPIRITVTVQWGDGNTYTTFGLVT